jgi:hypothetical protein
LEAKVEEPESRPAVKPRREEPPALQPLVPRIELPRLPEPQSPARSEAADPPRREAAEIRPVEPGRPAPAAAPPGLVVQPRVERAAPAPVPEIQPAPTIHVTIGRIEVRATAPQAAAAAPARRASAPAVLTLDEYLRRRDGERR